MSCPTKRRGGRPGGKLARFPMGGTGSGSRKRKAATAIVAVLPAQGGRTKRTPSSAFDSAAGKDIYNAEKVVGERLAKGVTQFFVKWAGYEAKDNTWEPLENLAGCEDMIVEFNSRTLTTSILVM